VLENYEEPLTALVQKGTHPNFLSTELCTKVMGLCKGEELVSSEVRKLKKKKKKKKQKKSPEESATEVFEKQLASANTEIKRLEKIKYSKVKQRKKLFADVVRLKSDILKQKKLREEAEKLLGIPISDASSSEGGAVEKDEL
jgi:hypothetical protein